MNASLLAIGVATMLVAMLCSAADGAPPTSDRDGLERKHRSLSMARVLAYLIGGALLSEATGLPTRSGVTQAIIVLIATTLLVIAAEGVARAVGFARGASARRVLAPVTHLAAIVLSPLVLAGATIEDVLRRALPDREMADEERDASAEQFREVVAAEAEVNQGGEALIHGVFSLGDTEVRDIMVPRVDIVGVEVTTPWSEVIDRVRSSEHSRLPVYEETLDEVVGILYAKDLLPAVISDEEPSDGWRALVRTASFIPTSKTIDAQLRDFKLSHTHIAIVSDEYGGTAGLVTIEDVLEEIVGDIRDEYDEAEPDVEREGATRFWVSGGLSLDELREITGAAFSLDDVQTVGGLVYALFGRVPRSGDAIVRDGFRIVVERVRRRRIERVYFERLASDERETES